MNKANTEKLFRDFPALYRGRTKPTTESGMNCGFLCDDGWFDLLYTLSADIIHLCQAEGLPVPEVMQVKQKLGLLRYYVRPRISDERIRIFIRRAEDRSGSVCECCGQPGTLRRSQRGASTLCDRCTQNSSART